mgnify:CR=1 FL=1
MQNVLKWFRELSKIPHVSGDEQRISDWLVKTAIDMGLEVEQDKAFNVIIKKGQGEPVILQGHMDMVGEKDANSPHDFAKDPLELSEREGMLYANGTTLGADNGLAVAMGLALLEDHDPQLPALEVLITTGEEVGLLGAHALAPGKLKGKQLINLDGETEGVFLTSCAGGETVAFALNMAREAQEVPCLEVSLGGFRGGHSGVEIDKDRLNAIKELAAWLKDKGARLAGFEAPGKFNAISRQARAYVTQASAEEILKYQRRQAEQWRQIEEDTQLVIREAAPLKPYTQEASQNLLDLITRMPNGVYTWSEDLPGLVESSSNLGVVEEGQDTLTLTASIRSSQPAKMAEIEDKMRALAKEFDAKVTLSGAYPGWAYEKESPLRDKAVKMWEAQFGSSPQVTAVHGGLECGVLKAKYPEIQMLSIGSNLHEVHTPREHADLASLKRVYGFLRELLKSLKQ